jgi:hypothetical protein
MALIVRGCLIQAVFAWMGFSELLNFVQPALGGPAPPIQPRFQHFHHTFVTPHRDGQ